MTEHDKNEILSMIEFKKYILGTKEKPKEYTQEELQEKLDAYYKENPIDE